MSWPDTNKIAALGHARLTLAIVRLMFFLVKGPKTSRPLSSATEKSRMIKSGLSADNCALNNSALSIPAYPAPSTPRE